MKQSRNTISDWLDKYGDPEIDKQVEKELEEIITKHQRVMNALENEYTITFRDKNDDSVTITSTGNLKVHSTKAHDKFHMTLECDDWEVVEKNIKYSTFTFEPVKDLQGIDQKDEPYTPREQALIFNAMQWAVKEITGRVMRETFTEVMVDDFIKEFSNK